MRNFISGGERPCHHSQLQCTEVKQISPGQRHTNKKTTKFTKSSSERKSHESFMNIRFTQDIQDGC